MIFLHRVLIHRQVMRTGRQWITGTHVLAKQCQLSHTCRFKRKGYNHYRDVTITYTITAPINWIIYGFSSIKIFLILRQGQLLQLLPMAMHLAYLETKMVVIILLT